MKIRFKYMLLTLGMSLAVTSCNLDSKVYSTFAESNFPKTEEDTRSMLTGLYAYFKCNSGSVNDDSNGTWTWPFFTLNNGGWLGISETTTDEAYEWENEPLHTFQWGSALDTYDTYNLNRNITRATYILNVVNNLTDISDDTRNELAAEVKCMRAWFMFYLYDLYGPIPFIVDPAKLDNIEYEARPTKEVYFNQMVTDLTEALPYLYDKTNNTDNWGKVNKGLATMLLMKLYMNDHQYDKALPYAESLTKMGYKLADTYNEVFTDEQNDENIWSVPSGINAGNETFFYTIPPECTEICGIQVAPYWGVEVMPWAFYDTYTAGDKRLEGIADHFTGSDGTYYSRTVNTTYRLSLGAVPVKYLLPKDQTSSGNIPFVAFRYADVLLSLAEIENNLNGPTDKALNYLKEITDRAGTTNTIPSDIQSSKDKFSEFLLAERGRELYLEGWRRQDLIRFGKYIEFAQKKGYPAKDYMTLFPIPPKVITESGGIVENNPGYE